VLLPGRDAERQHPGRTSQARNVACARRAERSGGA
jgi:hypothetical protein